MSVCQFDKVTLADKVTLFATLLSVYQLDKVSFCTFIRQKSVTCSDNAPTVAPDKVPLNHRLRAGSFLREQQRVAAPSSRVAFACVSLAAAPTATPCFRHWRRSLQLQNPRFRPCAYARGPTSRTFAGETPSPQPLVSGNFIRCYCRSVI